MGDVAESACLQRSSGAPANDEPRLKFSNSVRPCLRLRKTIQALGTQLSLGARPHATDSPPHARITPASHRTGADCHVLEKEATFEASWRDVWLGGELSLSDLSQLKWSKTWIFPGLADAATRVEVKSTLDLKTARPDVRFKLGLRRPFAPPGLSFVHDVPLDGKNGKAKLSVGATVTVPDELQLSAADVPAVVGGRGKAEVGAPLQPSALYLRCAAHPRDSRPAAFLRQEVDLLKQAYLAVDLDRLDLTVAF